VDLDAIEHELYGLLPEEFVAARTARSKEARSEGDRQLASRIAALRKPTVAAWAANQLVREHGDEVAVLLDLGQELRAGMQGLDGDELRTLTRRRHQLVAALVAQVEKLAHAAGRRLGPDAVAGVRATLEATLADAESAEALRRGCLSEPLEPPGFGFGELVPRAAEAEPEPSLDEGATVADLAAHRERKAKAIEDAEVEVAQAEEAYDDARARAAEAVARAEKARKVVDDATAAVDRLEKELVRARDELERHTRKAEKRRRKQEEAESATEEAEEALDDARTNLDRLKR
jgi:DNA repair exonuclease SbcCD ATPase subunit